MSSIIHGGAEAAVDYERPGLFLLAKETGWQERTPVLCQHCYLGPFVDLLQHAAIYGGRVHDADHLELALRLAREEMVARSAMMAQFDGEVSDDDGGSNTAGGGRGAEKGVGEDGGGDGGLGVGVCYCCWWA